MRNTFIYYNIIAAILWGSMAVVESFATQHSVYGALFVKFSVYGILGWLVLFAFTTDLGLVWRNFLSYTKNHHSLCLLNVFSIFLGAFGTFAMYCAFKECGSNKAIVIIIAYCIPVIVVFLLSYFVMKETYNIFALFGILSIIVGVLIINYYGVQKKNETNHTILQKEQDNTCTTPAPLAWQSAVDAVAFD